MSLATPILAAGRARADELFPTKRGGNFSAYLEWLISRDIAPAAARPELNEASVTYRSADKRSATGNKGTPRKLPGQTS